MLSVVLLLYISSVSYKHNQALTESSELLVHSYKIQLQLERVLSLLKEAEIAQRGYITTSDSVLLRPYKLAPGQIYSSYLVLKSLTIDNHEQQYNLDTLLQLINYRFKLMASTLQTSDAVPFNETELFISLRQGDHLMEDIQTQISKIDHLELLYLKNHQQTYEKEALFSPVSTFLFMIFSLLIFVLSFLKINKDVHLLKKSNEQLLIINESIKHAEVIGEFYIWQWKQATNELLFSDNLYRLLGVEPQSFPPSIAKYLTFVHPDDKHIAAKSEKTAFNERKSEPGFYRIIRSNGEVRYIMSVGKFIEDEGNKIYIRIGKDVTEQHMSNVELEERNRELEQSIRELESFNRVASHDLQEPLRKILIFSTLLRDKHKHEFSADSAAYLEKIIASSDRMRAMIVDILGYSRLSKNAGDFTLTNLREVVHEVMEDYEILITEKNAQIIVEELPEIEANRGQMKQVFQNLISNSIKFSKPDSLPLITISSEHVANPSFSLEPDHEAAVCCITISDNGIGFNEQYREKIFSLFERLNTKDKYEGSGIGLAITKKIIDKHHGSIRAVSEEGKGSSFMITLPLRQKNI